MNQILKTIYDNILEGQQKPVVEGVQAGLDAGLAPADPVDSGSRSFIRPTTAGCQNGRIEDKSQRPEIPGDQSPARRRCA